MSDFSCSIIGYSGHGLVVAEAAIQSGLNLQFYSDMEAKQVNPYQLQYIGDETKAEFAYWKKNIHFVLGIGNNVIRTKCANRVLNEGALLANVIHPSASITKEFIQGTGNFIARNVSINPMVRIGNFCIVNTNAVIEHECVIGNSVHIAPGAVLLGAVQIGDGSFIGANTVIKQGVKIGSNVSIMPGSIVEKDM